MNRPRFFRNARQSGHCDVHRRQLVPVAYPGLKNITRAPAVLVDSDALCTFQCNEVFPARTFAGGTVLVDQESGCSSTKFVNDLFSWNGRAASGVPKRTVAEEHYGLRVSLFARAKPREVGDPSIDP